MTEPIWQQPKPKTYYIYAMQNLVNFKLYIGQTVNPEKRLEAHKTNARLPNGHTRKRAIHYAMTKYGNENFSFETFEEWGTQEEVDEAEKYWIKVFGTQKIALGYNRNEGGQGPNNTPSNTKLTKQNILDIVAMYNTGNYTGLELASNFNVTGATISRIVRGECWANITGLNFVERGPINGGAKLTEQNVLDIVCMYNAGNHTGAMIADRFHVGESTINGIVNGKRWEHITGIIYDPSNAPRADLTDQDVLDIVAIHKTGSFTERELATKFDANVSSICRILNGKSYSKITGITPPPNKPKP